MSTATKGQTHVIYIRIDGAAKYGYTVGNQDAINFGQIDIHGQFKYTPLTGQLVMCPFVGRGRGQDQIRMYPLYYDIPEGEDTEYDDDFFAEFLRFLYVRTGGSSESDSDDSDDTAPKYSEQWEWEQIYGIFRFQGKILLLTHGGSPVGGWAIDAADHLFAWH